MSLCYGKTETVGKMGSLNTTSHSATEISPFEVWYGRPPPPILNYEREMCAINEVDQQMRACDEMLDL